jgi:hypothetical protein
MIEFAPKTRVLLIGAGARVKNNYLPVLTGMSDLIEIVGIHSRTPERLRLVAEAWNVKPVFDLEGVDFDGVDLVAASVPTPQNAVVMRKLLPNAARIGLVLDTPVAGSTAQLAEQAALARHFRQVSITEDYMNFPKFELVREAVRRGIVGRPKSLTLYNIGYRHHGLALIRSFTGFQAVVGQSRLALSAGADVISYRFADGFVGHVVGPYRRHSTGGLLLEGEDGLISEFPVDRKLLGSKPAYVLAPVNGPSGIEGHRISGPGQDIMVDQPLLRAMRSMSFDDKSDMNLERGCGLAQVFLHAMGHHNINRGYGISQAWYDSFGPRLAMKADVAPKTLDAYSLETLAGVSVSNHEAASEPPSPVSSTRLVAKVATALKRGLARAVTFSDPDRRAVQAGDQLLACTEPAERNHLKLTSVTLSDIPLEGIWYISGPAWEEKPIA